MLYLISVVHQNRNYLISISIRGIPHQTLITLPLGKLPKHSCKRRQEKVSPAVFRIHLAGISSIRSIRTHRTERVILHMNIALIGYHWYLRLYESVSNSKSHQLASCKDSHTRPRFHINNSISFEIMFLLCNFIIMRSVR